MESSGGPVAEAITQLQASLDVLGDAACWSLSDGQCRDAVAGVFADRQRLEAVWLRLVADLDSRPGAVAGARPGATAKTFLVHKVLRSHGRAAADVAAAKLAEVLPQVAAVFAAGLISREHVDVVTRALTRLPRHLLSDEGMDQVDGFLAGVLPVESPQQTQQLVRHLLAVLDPDGGTRYDPDGYARRGLSMTQDATGMLVGSFQADPAQAAVIKLAIDHASTPSAVRAEVAADGTVTMVADLRTAAQRRIDGLTVICQAYLDSDRHDHDTHTAADVAAATAEAWATADAADATADAAADAAAADAPSRRRANESSHSGSADDNQHEQDDNLHGQMADDQIADDGEGGSAGPACNEAAEDPTSWSTTSDHTTSDHTASDQTASDATAAGHPAAAPDADDDPGRPDIQQTRCGRCGHGDAFHRRTSPGRAQIVVHTDLDQLAAARARLGGAGLAHADPTGPIDGGTLSLLSCDSDLQRVVLSPATGAVLNLGRSVRTVTDAQRRALIARDLGCIVPACTTPAAWTHAHHVQYWADGGRSDLDNYALTCHRHHAEIHAGVWTITMINGLPWVRPPTWLDPEQRPIRNTIWDHTRTAQQLGRALRPPNPKRAPHPARPPDPDRSRDPARPPDPDRSRDPARPPDPDRSHDPARLPDPKDQPTRKA